MTTSEASVLLERAMAQLAENARQIKEAENAKQTARAVALNMSENLFDLRWHPHNNTIEIVTIKSKKTIH